MKISCSRNYDVSVWKHCSDTNGVIGLLPLQLRVHVVVKVTAFRRHSVKVLNTVVSNSIVAMVTDL